MFFKFIRAIIFILRTKWFRQLTQRAFLLIGYLSGACTENKPYKSTIRVQSTNLKAECKVQVFI